MKKLVLMLALAVAAVAGADIRAVTPVPQNADTNSWWMKRHAQKLERVKAGGSRVVFIGDSITHFWEGNGRAQWEKSFAGAPYHALNLGYSADRTEHVLWRLDHGELDGYEAKAVVLMIGTNNTGHWPFEKEPPADTIIGVRAVLDKIRAAGITPGFHTLQTHIGMRSSYVTPVADPRLNLTRHFTLMRDVPETGAVDELFVSENPVDSVIAGDVQGRCARVLKFGGELFTYEGYATTPPYRFTGVRRGAFKTRTAPHRRGDIGGILDMSEFGATSCYIDQRTDLQDEVAEKIARIYDQGMAFCYFDGSEGVNPPCGVYVPYSQYRVCAKFKKPPIFTEGAAKAHFGWHLQAGANAFDVFSPELFKRKIAEYPLAEAPVMRQDFTRLDFGWWSCVLPGKDTWRGKPSVGTQADQWEYGTSKAAAWDCPATIQIRRDFFQKHPRADDLLEVMRRWEDVRARKWLTPACRERLRDPAREFHLLLNGRGAYELVELTPAPVSAFVFERDGETYATWWHTSGSATLKLPAAVTLLARIDGEAVPTASENGRVALPADNRRYLKTRLSKADLVAAFAAAEIVQGM